MRDVNGTRFHLLLGEEDWAVVSSQDDLSWDPASSTVELRQETARFPRPAGKEPLRPSQNLGAGADRWGNLYWIAQPEAALDDAREIRLLPSAGDGGGGGGDQRVGSFWTADQLASKTTAPGDFKPAGEVPTQPPALLGLAVTAGHYLVVGTREPGGLLVFDLAAGGRPRWWTPSTTPGQGDFEPRAVAATPDGGAWVLDTGAEPARIWRFDRYLNPASLNSSTSPTDSESSDESEAAAAPDFLPADADKDAPAPPEPSSAAPPFFTVGPGGGDLHALVALDDCSVLVAEEGADDRPGRLLHFRDGRPAGLVGLEGILAPILQTESDGENDDNPDANLYVQALAFLPTRPSPSQIVDEVVRGELIATDRRGLQAFAFRLEADDESLHIEPIARYLPLRDATGQALAVVCDRSRTEKRTEVRYQRGREAWSTVAEHPRRRHATEATAAGLVFDGKVPEVTWHRLIIDACVPDDGSIRVRSRAADDTRLLPSAEWQPEPSLRLRAFGSEQPFHRPFGRVPNDARVGEGTWELLFQRARGRFLELELTLRGSGRTTPRLRALRVHYPRFSYLREYLPGAYGEDAASASFTERLLANVEGLFTALEGRVAAAEQLFDPRVAPPEVLPWLAGWLGAAFDPEWDDARRRLFLRHAHRLFRWRGTAAGLRAAIRLAIEERPEGSIFDELPDGSAMGNVCEPDGADRAEGVRIVERFRTRGAGSGTSVTAAALGDPRELERPRLSLGEEPWRPTDGAADLHRRYDSFLVEVLGREPNPDGSARTFPPLTPSEENQAADSGRRRADWLAFVRRVLDFPYVEVGEADLGAYRQFLRRRYGRFERLAAAWGLATPRPRRLATFQPAFVLPAVTLRAADIAFTSAARPSVEAVRAVASSFDDVTLPSVLPTRATPLRDWIDFVSVALPMRRAAHRFTVLIPAVPGEDPDLRRRRRETVTEVVEREKPAHTAFDVQLFWDLFRVGGARLGLDTRLGEGSRFAALVLGEEHLGESFLTPVPPHSLPDRTVLGNDPRATEPRL